METVMYKFMVQKADSCASSEHDTSQSKELQLVNKQRVFSCLQKRDHESIDKLGDDGSGKESRMLMRTWIPAQNPKKCSFERSDAPGGSGRFICWSLAPHDWNRCDDREDGVWVSQKCHSYTRYTCGPRTTAF